MIVRINGNMIFAHYHGLLLDFEYSTLLPRLLSISCLACGEEIVGSAIQCLNCSIKGRTPR